MQDATIISSDPGMTARCCYCGEELLAGEACFHVPPSHHECTFRAVIGGVLHLQRRCSCYVAGADENDPPGMTRREAARAALRLYQQLERLGVNLFAERIRSATI